MLSWVRGGLISTAASVLGTPYSPPSPQSHSSERSSPLYPSRPIRPLPKRRLRSRLSDDLVDAISYPRPPAVSTPLFYFPHSYSDPRNSLSGSDAHAQADHDSTCEHGHGDPSAEEYDSDEELAAARSNRLYQGQQDYVALNKLKASHASAHHPPQQAQSSNHRSNQSAAALNNKPPTPKSTTSSIDGYDSFENTNNKKKRKIPTPGNSNNHHSHLSADMASMGLTSSRETRSTSPDELGGGVGQYYGSGNSAASAGGSGNGLSGSGRGRFGRGAGRSASIRSPLGVSTDGTNAWANGRGGRSRPRDWTPSGLYFKDPPAPNRFPRLSPVAAPAGSPQPDQGIISAAIASAAESGLNTPTRGQENVSLLQQQANRKVTPTKTQFTFTSAANVTWPGGSVDTTQGPPLGGLGYGDPMGGSVRGQHARGMSMATQGTQTSPPMMTSSARSGQGPATSQHASSAGRQAHPVPGGTGNQQAAQPAKKTRGRRTGKEYALAARQRRLQQEYNNYHHPPNREDIWICDFCEYESIFGAPPEALMRQYEIKDRRERRRLAEKRRLLEKAKLKGRKGKKGKGGKNAAAAANTAAQQQSQHSQQQPPIDPSQMQSQGTQSDDYLDDEFEDDAAPTTAAVPQKPVRALNVANKAAATVQAVQQNVGGQAGSGGGGGGPTNGRGGGSPA